ncbi:hypothetical protein [Nitrosomonas sp.]|nr:hypothetical protein [Nitrosomonas sp.]
MNKSIIFIVLHACHERDQRIVIRPNPVEGLIHQFLSLLNQ